MLRTIDSHRVSRSMVMVKRGLRTEAVLEGSMQGSGSQAMLMGKQDVSSSTRQSTRKAREEGDISSVFASLAGESEKPLPDRFAQLKREIVGDEANQRRLVESWSRLTGHLEKVSCEIQERQQDCVPQTTYEEFTSSRSSDLVDRIKTCGSVIIRNVVQEETAQGWLERLREYIKLNPGVKGFPADDKQVFELYWSKVQLEARSHPRSMNVQKSLLRLFSHPPSARISTDTPLTYADRLRIRHPGDQQFALGPHVDGGSIERWEDETYRKVYKDVLKGNWEGFDAWTIGERGEAKQNLYDGPGSCGVFRAFQGWTSLSDTGPGEGTLRVYPLLKELTAYMMLRPLFREIHPRSSLTLQEYLAPANWTLDLETSRFPGSPPARGQEFNDGTHPHLQLDRTMVSMPRVKPGDQAWWHCDVIHAVEPTHQGSGPAAVLYIPAVPLTPQNADYVRDQRETFLKGTPAPDFPGGVGESQFVGKSEEGDVKSKEGRQAMGLEAFDLGEDLADGEREVRKRANEILGF
ncbi:hypothetical protein IAR55_002374 [Kwoniella newhampshirensis]|uniref:DUF1479 domain protein n=1 Tax=Kwoniella newhampshirensis TaxID=1651941 RepID=A0AAW0YU42_9TREE